MFVSAQMSLKRFGRECCRRACAPVREGCQYFDVRAAAGEDWCHRHGGGGISNGQVLDESRSVDSFDRRPTPTVLLYGGSNNPETGFRFQFPDPRPATIQEPFDGFL